MSDEQDRVTSSREAPHLGVDFRDERAGRVDGVQRAIDGLSADFGRDAMRREHDPSARGHLVEFLDEDRSLAREIVDDMSIVHDLAAHIHRWAVAIDRALDDRDRALDTGAESPWLGQQGAARHDHFGPV